jgi:hypothetical protein
MSDRNSCSLRTHYTTPPGSIGHPDHARHNTHDGTSQSNGSHSVGIGIALAAVIIAPAKRPSQVASDDCVNEYTSGISGVVLAAINNIRCTTHQGKPATTKV